MRIAFQSGTPVKIIPIRHFNPGDLVVDYKNELITVIRATTNIFGEATTVYGVVVHTGFFIMNPDYGVRAMDQNETATIKVHPKKPSSGLKD